MFSGKGRTTPLPCGSQTSASTGQGIEIGAGKEDIQPVFVFGQSPIGSLAVAEQAFDRAKWVLNLTAD